MLWTRYPENGTIHWQRNDHGGEVDGSKPLLLSQHLTHVLIGCLPTCVPKHGKGPRRKLIATRLFNLGVDCTAFCQSLSHSFGDLMGLAQIHSVLITTADLDAQLLFHGDNVKCHGQSAITIADGGRG
jgi:hypothetical protein